MGKTIFRKVKPPPPSAYRREFATIETADKVKLEYRIANPLLRFCAFLIDLLLLAGLVIVFIYLLDVTHIGNALGGLFDPEKLQALLYAFWYIVLFVLRWGYYLFFEMLFEGRTPGKMICGLRTIHYQGKALDLPSLVLRNFARVLDQELTFFLGALICMLVNREYRRIGDLLANTIVVKDERTAPVEKTLRPVRPRVAPLPEARDAVFLRRLTEEELYVLRRFLVDQANIPQPRRAELIAKMAETVKRKIQDSFEPKEPLAYLWSVHERHQVADAAE
jgi:uncharacterized RDD family membrane protein YckC